MSIVLDCHDCNWSGYPEDLVCTDEDPDCFTHCPNCEGTEFDEWEEDDEDDDDQI